MYKHTPATYSLSQQHYNLTAYPFSPRDIFKPCSLTETPAFMLCHMIAIKQKPAVHPYKRFRST